MIIRSRNDIARTADILVGYKHFRHPLYCPMCPSFGNSTRWFDVTVLVGRMQKKCPRCKYTVDIEFVKNEPT